MPDLTPDLTPAERELLENPGRVRGYTPTDGAAEPTTAPSDPASTSPAKDDQDPT
ncbi:hypothetical protein GCM10009804_46700 [Kribbella hippodromi]|uniref:Uncharacterized protein n=1 Tax=Kribbella hippodromi TaxID=434347 RepID=A0ABN2DS82_9ACTN